MACDLRLGEHTAQMYVSSNIVSFDHVIHKNEHIKDRLTNIFNQSKIIINIVFEHEHQMNASCFE